MRRTLTFLILLLALLSVIFFAEKRKKDMPDAGETENSILAPDFLFREQESNVVGLKIIKDNMMLELERREDGLWDVIQPVGAEVEQSVVEGAAAQILSLPVLVEDLSLSASEVGLWEQAIQVSVSFSGGKISAFRIGDSTPSGSGYYIQMDDESIHIVDLDSLNTFLKLFEYFNF